MRTRAQTHAAVPGRSIRALEDAINVVAKVNLAEVGKVIRSAKRLAKRYYALTGRPLGITGEVAEYEAARLLRLRLLPARSPGSDAERRRGTRIEKIQVKGRCVMVPKPGQRMGTLDLKKPWDAAMLVMLDADFEPTAIYEASRRHVKQALLTPGSKARNERGALTVSKFKSIGKQLWARK